MAEAIGIRLDIPQLDLDAVHWLPGWTERDADDFRRIVFEFAEGHPRWVIAGNYTGRLGELLDHLVDTYVWLDLPRWRVTSAVFARTVRRSIMREELWGTGNRERLRSLVKRDPLDNIVLWAWRYHDAKTAQYEAAQRAGRHAWFRLRSRSEVRRFLEGLRRAD